MLLLNFCALLIAGQKKSAPIWTAQAFEGRATISAPVKLAKFDTASVRVGEGEEVDVWIAKSEANAYQVTMLKARDTSKWKSAVLLNGFASGLIKEGSKLIGERDLLRQGWLGLAMTLQEQAGATIVQRAFFCGDVLIGAAFSYPTSQQRPPESDRFLDSLRIATNGLHKQAGVELTRFELGGSGISALFPRKPTKYEGALDQSANPQKFFRYSADFAFRSFLVFYRDTTAAGAATITGEQRKQIYAAATQEIVRAFEAKEGKKRECSVGKDAGIRTELSMGGDMKGTVVVFLHGIHLLSVVEFGPTAYDAPSTVESFLASVQFKS